MAQHDPTHDADHELPEPGDPDYERKRLAWQRLIQEGVDSARNEPLVSVEEAVRQGRRLLDAADARQNRKAAGAKRR